MGFYFSLIALMLVLSGLAKGSIKNVAKRENFVLSVGILVLYLVFALKNISVGSDIVGYEEMYKLAGKIPWDDYTKFYGLEDGYVFLTKVFSKMGFSFQGFMAVAYAVIYIPLFRFLKKHSHDVTLSIVIYICYQFFVFNLSGVRQAIAMGICLIAFEFAFKSGFKNFLVFLLLTIMATKVHDSAAIFLLFYFVIRIQVKPTTLFLYLGVLMILIFGRNFINKYILDYFESGYEVGRISLGGSFIFLIGITILGLLSNKGEYMANTQPGIIQKNVTFENAYMPIMLMSVLCYVLLSGSTMLRAAMYYTMFMMVILPNYIQRYNYRDRLILRAAIMIFMFMIFYFETLVPNQLGLIPYKFFWQE